MNNPYDGANFELQLLTPHESHPRAIVFLSLCDLRHPRCQKRRVKRHLCAFSKLCLSLQHVQDLAKATSYDNE